jgi:excinuclease ABC subunit C
MIDLLKLPSEPGCYLFKDSKGIIVYIGKAKNLKKRVSSYFQKRDHDPKTISLVSVIDIVDFIITQNEKEALILENNLIKNHKPRYNIDLRDSKRFAFILLTDERYPRLIVARDRLGKGTYFGPFVSAEKRDIILKFAINTFRLRTCKLNSKRPCLRYQMGLCSGACVGKISEVDYDRSIEDAKALLSGKVDLLLKNLTIRLKEKSEKQDYEEAKTLRDQILAIESLKVKQNMERKRVFDQDVINYLVIGDTVNLVIMHFQKGIMLDKEEYEFSINDDFFEEFVARYYSEQDVPNEIIVPETVPEKGDKKDLLMLAKKNIEKKYLENEIALNDLKEKLMLPEIPKVIECFDISHISGSDSVGSMVRFSDGKPDKTNYRRFRIKTIDGIDDFAMIAEVVHRRYTRLIDEKKELPDLIVIDGGKGQLSSAMEVLKKLSLKIPTIGLAKRNEEIYFPGRQLSYVLDKKTEALKLLQRIRDEAHRFAIKYHKLLRKKRIKN